MALIPRPHGKGFAMSPSARPMLPSLPACLARAALLVCTPARTTHARFSGDLGGRDTPGRRDADVMQLEGKPVCIIAAGVFIASAARMESSQLNVVMSAAPITPE